MNYMNAEEAKLAALFALEEFKNLEGRILEVGAGLTTNHLYELFGSDFSVMDIKDKDELTGLADNLDYIKGNAAEADLRSFNGLITLGLGELVGVSVANSVVANASNCGIERVITSPRVTESASYQEARRVSVGGKSIVSYVSKVV